MHKLVVITGYNSFIGKTFTSMNKLKFDIFNIKSPHRNKSLRNEYDLETIDQKLKLKRYDQIFFLHLASYTSYLKQNLEQEQLSIDFTQCLVNKIKELNNKVPAILVHTSTIGVLEKRAKLFFSGTSRGKQSEVYASSSYGRMKIEMEKIVNTYEYSANLRLGWIYGPGMRKSSHISWINQSVKKGSLWTKIGWPGLVTPLHVEDLCVIMSEIIDRISIPSEIKAFKDAIIAGSRRVSFEELFLASDPNYSATFKIPSFMTSKNLEIFLPLKLRGLLGNIYGIASSPQVKQLQTFMEHDLSESIKTLRNE
jgi:nucleoside-diphosphate-sugar epimerase